MERWGMGAVEIGRTFGKQRFVLWTDGWEKVVEVECAQAGQTSAAAAYALSVLMQECLERGVEEVQFVGDYPKLWARMRKMQKETKRSNDFCAANLFDLLTRFKSVRFHAV